MSTLDDKLLGEKMQYYCSSSEDEDHEDSDADQGNEQDLNNKASTDSAASADVSSGGLTKWDGTCCNTGPKGVIKDYQRFKQLEKERREDQKEELKQLTNKFAITCRTNAEDEDEKLEAELNELMNDSSIQQFVQQRMQEMLANDGKKKKFGSVQVLKDSQQFLAAVDNEDENVCVVCLLHEPGRDGCKSAVESIASLARVYPHVKFCSVRPSLIAMSSRFESAGVPALLSYRGGQLTGNLVRLTDDLGQEFEESDLESYLVENGILTDRFLLPVSVNAASNGHQSSDDDEH